MKRITVLDLLSVAAMVVFSACAKENFTPTPQPYVTPALAPTTIVCPSDQTYTAQFGCLPSTNCAQGTANLNGQCVAIGANPIQCPPNLVYDPVQGCVAVGGGGDGWHHHHRPEGDCDDFHEWRARPDFDRGDHDHGRRH